MQIPFVARTGSLLAVAALALAACGSPTNDDVATDGPGLPESECFSGTLSGQGSSAQANAMQLATTEFANSCRDARVNYAPSSSGQGITAFLANQVNWAGSDTPLSPTKREPAKAAATCGSKALNLPMMIGPIAVAYNLNSVGKLTLTPQLIAQIFSGKITVWNDPAVAAANPGVTLPDTRISVFFRSDSSGTTDNFTDYLHTTSPADWPQEPAKQWSGKAGQGKPKSAGVSSAVQATDGGISYVEWSFAITNSLTKAQIDNGGGAVALTAQTASRAAQAATTAGAGNDLALDIDYASKTPGTYPIVLVAYEIVCSRYSDPKTARAVKSFLSYVASEQFQSKLPAVGAAPLPPPVQTKVLAAIDSIT